eukprot:5922649-Amphidinium_carterae.1
MAQPTRTTTTTSQTRSPREDARSRMTLGQDQTYREEQLPCIPTDETLVSDDDDITWEEESGEEEAREHKTQSGKKERRSTGRGIYQPARHRGKKLARGGSEKDTETQCGGPAETAIGVSH